MWQRSSVWIGCFGFLFVFAFRQRLPGLFNLWLTHAGSSVGLLVPFVSALLVWRKRDRLAGLQTAPSAWGPVVLLLIAAGANLLPSTGLLFATYWAGVALTMGGFRLLRELLFPIGLLVFVVPIPLTLLNIFDYPLQMASAVITGHVAGFAGVPVVQQGPVLRLTHTQILIAPACNGLGSAAALFLIGLVAAHVAQGRTWARTLLPVVAVLLAYLSNLLRLFLNVLITNALGSSSWLEYEVTYDLLLGLLTFVAACLLFARSMAILKCRLEFVSAS